MPTDSRFVAFNFTPNVDGTSRILIPWSGQQVTILGFCVSCSDPDLSPGESVVYLKYQFTPSTDSILLSAAAIPGGECWHFRDSTVSAYVTGDNPLPGEVWLVCPATDYPVCGHVMYRTERA